MADLLEIPTNTLGLHTLYDSKERTGNQTIDIVAVHGLGGDSFSTWRHNATGNIWLRDFLPRSEYGKDARIMTFGYDARAFIHPFSQTSMGRTFTFAEALLNDLSDSRRTKAERSRPIIFVGHSMGGLVIKMALTHAHARPTLYGNILDSTNAIIFFGTPHQGANMATWATFLTKLSTGLGIASSKAIQELQTWSTPLVELATAFSEIAPKFEITTFFEQKNTHGVLVVPEGSARLGQQRERTVGLNTDHREICKFADENDANYKRVLKRMEAIMIEISESADLILPKLPSNAQDRDLEERFKALDDKPAP